MYSIRLASRTEEVLSDWQSRLSCLNERISLCFALVDSYAGSPAFTKAARQELEDMFGTLKPLSVDPALAEGKFEGGVDLTSGVGFTLAARQQLRARGDKPEGQKLLVALVNKRPAVIFSEFDLVAAASGAANYRSLAYKPEAARKILGNVLIYLNLE
jgi:hypothetical protein